MKKNIWLLSVLMVLSVSKVHAYDLNKVLKCNEATQKAAYGVLPSEELFSKKEREFLLPDYVKEVELGMNSIFIPAQNLLQAESLERYNGEFFFIRMGEANQPQVLKGKFADQIKKGSNTLHVELRYKNQDPIFLNYDVVTGAENPSENYAYASYGHREVFIVDTAANNSQENKKAEALSRVTGNETEEELKALLKDMPSESVDLKTVKVQYTVVNLEEEKDLPESVIQVLEGFLIQNLSELRSELYAFAPIKPKQNESVKRALAEIDSLVQESDEDEKRYQDAYQQALNVCFEVQSDSLKKQLEALKP